MASPWITPTTTTPHEPVDRPWMGLALLLSIPLLALILIRMLWSGSGLWFLMLGIICLGSAAVLFLARRNDPYARSLADEPNRVPLVLMGIGALFLSLLILPNFSDGGSGPAAQVQQQQQQSSGLASEVSGVSQQPVQRQPTAITNTNSSGAAVQDDTRSQVPLQPQTDVADTTEVEAPVGPVVPEGSTTYIVQDGDTLWDIAIRFDTTVEEIIAANALDDPEDIQVDQELAIPPPSTDAGAGSDSASEETDAIE